MSNLHFKSALKSNGSFFPLFLWKQKKTGFIHEQIFEKIIQNYHVFCITAIFIIFFKNIKFGTH